MFSSGLEQMLRAAAPKDASSDSKETPKSESGGLRIIEPSGAPALKTITLDTSELKKQKRVLLISTHCHQMNGYSKVAWNILKVLDELYEFELYHFGAQRMVGLPDSFRPYPIGVTHVSPDTLETDNKRLVEEAHMGFSLLPSYIESVKPDCVIFYNDAFVICRYVDAFMKVSPAVRANIRTIAYLDQVYMSQKIEHVKYLNEHIDQFFVFSSEWKKTLRGHGIRKPIGVVPHGFDGTLICRADKQDIRSKMSVPEDAFLIVNVNRNMIRKRYDLVVMAFAELVMRHPKRDVRLLCVCDKGQRGGYSIVEIYINEIKKRGGRVEDHIGKIIMVSQDQCHSDEIINAFYSSADVGLTCADAEGFGLCTFEMMGLGIPQVVPDHIGFTEYCNSANSIIVPTKYTYYVPNSVSAVAGEARSVDPADVANALERYMNDPGLRQTHGRAAGLTVNDYKWSVVLREFIHCIRLI